MPGSFASIKDSLESGLTGVMQTATGSSSGGWSGSTGSNDTSTGGRVITDEYSSGVLWFCVAAFVAILAYIAYLQTRLRTGSATSAPSTSSSTSNASAGGGYGSTHTKATGAANTYAGGVYQTSYAPLTTGSGTDSQRSSPIMGQQPLTRVDVKSDEHAIPMGDRSVQPPASVSAQPPVTVPNPFGS